MADQIQATKRLVAAASAQLMGYRVDRDKGTDWPPEERRFDAFFALPETEPQAFLVLTSVGVPDESEGGGLFIRIYRGRDDKGRPREFIGLQTAKQAEAVQEGEALWLSGYTPEQLRSLATLVSNAKPMPGATYETFFRPVAT